MNPKNHPIYKFRNFSNDRSSSQNDQLIKIAKFIYRVNFVIHRKNDFRDFFLKKKLSIKNSEIHEIFPTI